MENQDEGYTTKIDMKLIPDFTWPAILAVSIKTQLHGYFCYKGKNSAIWLTL